MADKVTLTPANFVSSTYPPITLFYFLFWHNKSHTVTLSLSSGAPCDNLIAVMCGWRGARTIRSCVCTRACVMGFISSLRAHTKWRAPLTKTGRDRSVTRFHGSLKKLPCARSCWSGKDSDTWLFLDACRRNRLTVPAGGRSTRRSAIKNLFVRGYFSERHHFDVNVWHGPTIQ